MVIPVLMRSCQVSEKWNSGPVRAQARITPTQAMKVTGWPVATVRRGAVVMRDGVVQAEPGTGRFLPRGPYAMATPRGVLAHGFDAAPPG